MYSYFSIQELKNQDCHGLVLLLASLNPRNDEEKTRPSFLSHDKLIELLYHSMLFKLEYGTRPLQGLPSKN